MDQDMDGSVTFEEYLVVMSMLSRGSLDEKLQWVFNLYDSNGDGQLTTDKLTIVATSVYEMLGSYTDPPWIRDNTIKAHVTRVFSVRTKKNCVLTDQFHPHKLSIFFKMDSNKDGILTFTEFKEYCVNVSIGVVESCLYTYSTIVPCHSQAGRYHRISDGPRRSF